MVVAACESGLRSDRVSKDGCWTAAGAALKPPNPSAIPLLCEAFAWHTRSEGLAGKWGAIGNAGRSCFCSLEHEVGFAVSEGSSRSWRNSPKSLGAAVSQEAFQGDDDGSVSQPEGATGG